MKIHSFSSGPLPPLPSPLPPSSLYSFLLFSSLFFCTPHCHRREASKQDIALYYALPHSLSRLSRADFSRVSVSLSFAILFHTFCIFSYVRRRIVSQGRLTDLSYGFVQPKILFLTLMGANCYRDCFGQFIFCYIEKIVRSIQENFLFRHELTNILVDQKNFWPASREFSYS